MACGLFPVKAEAGIAEASKFSAFEQIYSMMNSGEFGQMPPGEVSLSDEERQFLVDIIDASMRVFKRHHFFSWTQGVVQSLLPHEILVCGIGLGYEQSMRMYRFSSCRYFNDEHFAAVCEPEAGLLRQMMGGWEMTGHPCLISGSGHDAECNRAWVDLLQRHELRNAAAHGLHGADGTIKSYYCFARVPEPFSPRLTYMLKILVPFLDATLSRVLAQEEREGHDTARAQFTITGRETQILRKIKDGHTNIQIAALLEISPHTVKNHVRKILLKLGVQTRAQATAKAMQLGMLKISRE